MTCVGRRQLQLDERSHLFPGDAARSEPSPWGDRAASACIRLGGVIIGISTGSPGVTGAAPLSCIEGYHPVTTILKHIGSRLRRYVLVIGIVGGAVVALHSETDHAPWKTGIDWPKPKVIDPGPPGSPPSDAVVLFDGKGMSQWDGAEKWTVQDGCVVAGGRDI